MNLKYIMKNAPFLFGSLMLLASCHSSSEINSTQSTPLAPNNIPPSQPTQIVSAAPTLTPIPASTITTTIPPLPLPVPVVKPAPVFVATWQDQWWLNKASRALRGGSSLTENPNLLLANGKENALDQFFSDPRFGDTVLDFSLMYLGFRQDTLKDETGVYLPSVFAFSSAILASKEVVQNGDFFRIFDLAQSVYLAPLRRPGITPVDPTNPPVIPTVPVSDASVRANDIVSFRQSISNLITFASQPAVSPQEICAQVKNHLTTYINGDLLRIRAELPTQLFYSSDYYSPINNYCSSNLQKPFDFVSNLKAIQAKNEILFASIAPYAKESYKPSQIKDIQVFDLSKLEPSYQFHQYDSLIINQTLPNSSTNYDRKRGAYILKRFLCDDLTPVNVENPSAHAGDVHGSNPSCFACHYKLDPMAGFFRLHGTQFKDYTGRQTIQFDDGASMLISDYVKAWQATPADTLNVGYIRSTQDTSANYYGSTLDDLYGFLKKSPEARRCIVKRAYEYLVSDQQTIDGDYLDYLTAQFNQTEASQGSAAALKSTFKSIVLGQAFSQRDANRDTCYDHRPGYTETLSAVPCKVASILNNNCVHCHASTDDSGQLDLSKWSKMDDGSFAFPHLDANRAQRPPSQTFQSILDRLGSTDSEVRMPYQSDMPSQDRQQLFLWVNDKLTKGSK